MIIDGNDGNDANDVGDCMERRHSLTWRSAHSGAKLTAKSLASFVRFRLNIHPRCRMRLEHPDKSKAERQIPNVSDSASRSLTITFSHL